MKDRIRRALKVPDRSHDNETFMAEMNADRELAITESRKTIHRINKLQRVLCDGEINYSELNRAMFGRPEWPREEKP